MAKMINLFLVVLLMTLLPHTVDAWINYVVGAALGGAVVSIGAPAVIGAVGFKAAGISAGSIAAKAMSLAYTSGIGAGVVATLQSAGAAGIGAVYSVAGALVGAGVFRWIPF